MAKLISAAEIDGGLLKTNEADQISVCTSQPTNYAEATTAEPGGRMLAMQGLTAPEKVIGAGDTTNGRKITITPATAITIAASGTAGHVVLTNIGNTELLAITTCNALALDVGGGTNTVTVPAYKREGQQPT